MKQHLPNSLHQVPKKLGEILLEKKLITVTDLNKAMSIQQRTHQRLGEILVQQGVISEEVLLEALSLKFNLPKTKVDSFAIQPDVLGLIPFELIKRHKLVPLFQVEDTLTVAVVEPLDRFTLETMRQLTGLKVNQMLALAREVEKAISTYYSKYR